MTLSQILYARWRLPKPAAEYLPEMEKGLSANVHNDLNWLEDELSNSQSGGKFLVGNDITAADIIMGFNTEFIFARKLGTEGGSWPHIQRWFAGIKERDSYKKAVEKTGYSL